MSSSTRNRTSDLRKALLAWYDRAARDLPWRRTRDPYAIWVSEIMLQQTRVDTVLGYYEPFLEAFPTADALASAPEDAVLAAWSGLGYYRRARLLHRGVREVVARYGGRVPEDADARKGLPGIGRYTAGAIGSIAFDRPEPLVDGNVTRVLSRVHGIDTPVGRADTDRALWMAAERLVQGPRPGALNQALMELGATLCARRAPRCAECPIAGSCEALRSGRTEDLPMPRPRPLAKPTPYVVVVAKDAAPADGSGLWLRRAESGLFAGLWNLPMAEGTGRPVARAALSAAGLQGTLGRIPSARLDHILTHRRLQVEVWGAHGVTCRTPRTDCKSVQRATLSTLGISTLTRKCLKLLDA